MKKPAPAAPPRPGHPPHPPVSVAGGVGNHGSPQPLSSSPGSSPADASVMSLQQQFARLANKDDPDQIFEIMEIIGSGSYGEVYKAKTKTSGLLAAVKLVKLEPGEDLEEVLNEVNFLKSCSHQNIVSYLGCYMKRGSVRGMKTIWIAMEHCGGGSVEAAYKNLRSNLNQSEISVIVREALVGLHFLHKYGKLHRDIKCGNILLTEDGQVKLADFGVSTQITKTFSKRHTFIGTPYWMAPEVITSEQQGTSYDHKADIWSMGITAIEMAEQGPPMFDMHPMRVLFTIPKAPPPTLKDASWSPAFREFLALCLNKDPDKRPTADTLLAHEFLAETVAMDPAVRCKIVVDLIERAREAKRIRMGKAAELGGEGGAGMVDPDEEEDGAGEEERARNVDTDEEEDDEEDEDGRASTVKRIHTLRGPGSGQKRAPQQGDAGQAADKKGQQQQQQPPQQHRAAPSPPAVAAGGKLDIRPASAAAPTQPVKMLFKAARICRLGKKINCADFIGPVLLLGVDDGLFALDTADSGPSGGGGSKLHPLSNRRYLQLDCIEEIGTMLSRSGKHEVVCLHEVSASSLSFKLKFETETKLKKIKETKGCDMYTVGRTPNAGVQGGVDVTLCVSVEKTRCLVLRWLNGCFVRLLEVPLQLPIKTLDLVDSSKLFIGHETHFDLIDLVGMTLETLKNPVGEEKTGPVIRATGGSNGQYLMVYQNMGFVLEETGSSPQQSNNSNGSQARVQLALRRKLVWRHPVQFADRVGSEHVALCGTTLLDVWHIAQGKVVHIFETKKDRLRGLSLLMSKDAGMGQPGGKVYLLSDEEKDGEHTYSVLCISTEPVAAGGGGSPTPVQGQASAVSAGAGV
ncbi:kinase-like domain-containing protein [Catenaria anguillulae PL171]|uniref:non-specific serine/threonine protein kinase n=1 Tax=Catenaria anguillulae PL171 TaxID=765915 RepID=A0A1Y2HM70_9FUNG|nr:kinase-like domain-containing protein [Catenaria anguillulae PL171]